MDFEAMMEAMPKEKPEGAKGMCAHCGQPLMPKIEIEIEQKGDSEDMQEADEAYAEGDEPESGDDMAKQEKKAIAIAALKKKLMG
jgi:hypothetical protein